MAIIKQNIIKINKNNLLTLPETLGFVCVEIYLGKLANSSLRWENVDQHWISVESELLWAFGVWIVDVLLESDAEWQRDLVRSVIW